MGVEKNFKPGKGDSSSLQLIQGREYLETSYLEISKFQQNLDMSFVNDLEEVIDAASSFNELAIQVSSLINLFELKNYGLFFLKSQQQFNGLRRILELSTASSSQLEEMVDEVCWGKPIGAQVEQLEQNIYPLKQLLGDTVNWLNFIIDGPKGLESTSL